MAIAREAEPVGSLKEVREAGLLREDLLGVYRNMVMSRGIEERGHILYRQGKIPGSFYTGRGNEGAAVGVATAMGPDDVGTPLHRDMGVHIVRGVEPWRIFAQFWAGRTARRRAGRQRPHGGFEAWADRDGQPPTGDAAGGGRLCARFRIREEKRVAVGWFGEGASARGDTHRSMTLAGVRKLPWSSSATTTSGPIRRRRTSSSQRSTSPTAQRRTASRNRRRRHRRARLTAKRSARSRRRARAVAHADRVRHASDGRPRRPRRRLLRPEGAVREVGRKRPDRRFRTWLRTNADMSDEEEDEITGEVKKT